MRRYRLGAAAAAAAAVPRLVTAATSVPLPLHAPQLIKLKGALNEKEMEIIELREQHMQLVVRARGVRQQQPPLRGDRSAAVRRPNSQPQRGPGTKRSPVSRGELSSDAARRLRH
jgi:hypothetical protein